MTSAESGGIGPGTAPATPNRWVFPAGRLARPGWECVVDPAVPGWRWAGLRVAVLDGGTVDLPPAATERMVVPIAGAFAVTTADRRWSLEGRPGPFDGPTDVLYLGAGSGGTVSGRGRVAVAEAPAASALPDRRLAASDVPVELRGAGAASRQVHGFGMPGTIDAERLLVCEVITPAGNWSSYPAHKHDEERDGETRLEEVYWFATRLEQRAVTSAADEFGVFATTSSPAGSIETAALVRTGDVALVPYGWHGPAAAPPGIDLYYLNVMAGPGPERAWRISDHPDQAWVRAAWLDQSVDPRLPTTRSPR